MSAISTIELSQIESLATRGRPCMCGGAGNCHSYRNHPLRTQWPPFGRSKLWYMDYCAERRWPGLSALSVPLSPIYSTRLYAIYIECSMRITWRFNYNLYTAFRSRFLFMSSRTVTRYCEGYSVIEQQMPPENILGTQNFITLVDYIEHCADSQCNPACTP
jgi:hypothetical protein